jgi:hypothetical protein
MPPVSPVAEEVMGAEEARAEGVVI